MKDELEVIAKNVQKVLMERMPGRNPVQVMVEFMAALIVAIKAAKAMRVPDEDVGNALDAGIFIGDKMLGFAAISNRGIVSNEDPASTDAVLQMLEKLQGFAERKAKEDLDRIAKEVNTKQQN